MKRTLLSSTRGLANKCWIAVFLTGLLQSHIYAVGEAAVVTLVFPYGARTGGMAEAGTSLADDECMIFTNPAGLGQYLDGWDGGSQTVFYEPLLPAFNLPDLWHFATAFVIRPGWGQVGTDMGGFSFSWNYINFGEIEWTDQFGRAVGRARSWEGVWSLGWGFPFAVTDHAVHHTGLFVKYVHSALAPGYGTGDEGVGRTFAVDAGYLLTHYTGARFGLSLMNMGPNIYYISKDDADPIPFTVSLGTGYKRQFVANNFKILGVAFDHSIRRECVRNHFEKRPDPFWKAIVTSWTSRTLEENLAECILHWGFEATIMNTGSLRGGYMYDRAGYRREVSLGGGFSFLNHFNADFSYIHSPHDMSVARHGQWRISFALRNLLQWSFDDPLWMMADSTRPPDFATEE